MHTVLFYFSGTGNTWWASSELKKCLERAGGTVEMYSLENPLLQQEGFAANKIGCADHIIIGYPIYGSDMPKNMMTFVNGLPVASRNKMFSAFCTQAAFSGDGSVFFKRDVEKKGYTFLHGFQVNMTTNFNVAMLPFSLARPAAGAKLEKIKDKALQKINRMAQKINESEKFIEGKWLWQILPGHLQRFFFRRSEKKLRGLFTFVRERCLKCGLCAGTCSTNNILFEPEGPQLKRKDNCLLCFRCYNFCPGKAINYGGKVTEPERYIRYKGPVDGLEISDIRR